ncbi:MAG TPA: magnesium transporter [Clostridiales bacterium]|nr:magnesium transporter [Clostridiales bacterium]
MEQEKLIEQLLEEKKYIQVKETLSQMNEVDVAELLKPYDDHMTLLLFRMLPKDLAAEVFAYFTPEQQLGIISSVTNKELGTILDELFFDDMIDLIEEMPANIVNKILTHATKEERELINEFLRYPADSAGSLMTIEYVDLKKYMTVKQAMDHIKATGLNKETIYTCYVTDRNRILLGIVSLRTLVISDEDEKIEDIMETDIIKINTHDDQEEIANIFRKYGFLALPVVDKEGRLTGIITVDDIMDVISQEATEDFQKMAAMAPSDEEYLDASIFKLARNRLPWLLVLMISATFTGRIMSRYENMLVASAVLATFIPMLMDTGGNAGSQSSTLIIRGLATGDIEPGDGFKILFKEFFVSFIVGITLALTNFVRLILIEKIGIWVALTVSTALLVTVIVSKLVGGILPIFAKKLKMDPAIMAGPLITTIVDALSLITYFSIAKAILGL